MSAFAGQEGKAESPEHAGTEAGVIASTGSAARAAPTTSAGATSAAATPAATTPMETMDAATASRAAGVSAPASAPAPTAAAAAGGVGGGSSASASIVIGVVGKPSVGKSTFFNAVTPQGKAKMGNYPFTTIEPNTGVTFYRTECPCRSRGRTDVCAPRYGKCVKGQRFIPVKLLDVAGLVPGASEGQGLGNRFLDHLRHASVLIHILDVSGTTNEKGEVTTGFDPLEDADWLQSEIHAWVFNNLWKRWPSIARRHSASRASVSHTMASQLSGYGATSALINRVLDSIGIRDPVVLTEWDEAQVHTLVDAFLHLRFPTILLLNKADHQSPDTDRNIANIMNKYGGHGSRSAAAQSGAEDDRLAAAAVADGAGGAPARMEPQYQCIVGSAAAENFLKSCRQRNYIVYKPADSTFFTKEDWQEELDFRRSRGEEVSPDDEALLERLQVPEDARIMKRLNKIKDMLMYRFGGTGVWDAVQAAVDVRQPVVVYPVRSLTNFAAEADGTAVFGSCVLLHKGASVADMAQTIVRNTTNQCVQYVEGEDGRRLGEDTVLEGQNVIVKITLRELRADERTTGGAGGGGGGKSSAGGAGSANDVAPSAEDESKT